jgi:hypothetical protein
MSKKNLGVALLVIGVIVLLVSMLADSIGIGGTAGFGYKQIAGAVAVHPLFQEVISNTYRFTSPKYLGL